MKGNFEECEPRHRRLANMKFKVGDIVTYDDYDPNNEGPELVPRTGAIEKIYSQMAFVRVGKKLRSVDYPMLTILTDEEAMLWKLES